MFYDIFPDGSRRAPARHCNLFENECRRTREHSTTSSSAAEKLGKLPHLSGQRVVGHSDCSRPRQSSAKVLGPAAPLAQEWADGYSGNGGVIRSGVHAGSAGVSGFPRCPPTDGCDRPPGYIRVFRIPAADDGIGHSQIHLREQVCGLQQVEMMLLCKRDGDGIPEVGRIARIPEKRSIGFIRCTAAAGVASHNFDFVEIRCVLGAI